MPTTYLTFHLSRETYAVALASVSEIAAYPERIARVPTAPDWMRGVFNLRGSVVPAIDLCCKLGYDRSTATDRSCVLITQITVDGLELQLGLIVDMVNDLIELNDAQIEPPPAFGSALRVECLLGTTRCDDEIVCVLDLPRMFRDEELLAAALADARSKAAREPARTDLDRISTQPPPEEDTDPGVVLF
jgi:purine-binding chemotaxis protein CheW